MKRICKNCGNELGDNAKFCSKCGSKYEEVVNEKTNRDKCPVCGSTLEKGEEFCTKCGAPVGTQNEADSEKRKIEKATDILTAGITQAGTAVADGIDKGKDKFNEYQNLSEEEKREKKQQYIDSAKEKSKEFTGDVKNFKTLPKKRKKRVILTISGVLVLFLVLFSVIGNKGFGGLSSEEKIEIAKNTVIGYLPAEDLLSSGGVAFVMWSADENEVKAIRDDITFRFVVNSDGSCYFDGAEKYGDEISEETLILVFDQYCEIGQLRGTL